MYFNLAKQIALELLLSCTILISFCCISYGSAPTYCDLNDTATLYKALTNRQLTSIPSSSVVLLTSVTNDILPYATYSLAINSMYAKRHQYSYHIINTDDSKYVDLRKEVQDARWYKIYLLLQALHPDNGYARDCEYIVWLDADLILLNHDFSFEKLIHSLNANETLNDIHGSYSNSIDIIMSKDIDNAPFVSNSGTIILRNSQYTYDFLLLWYNNYNKQTCCDQNAFTWLYNRQIPADIQSHVQLLSVDHLNSNFPAWRNQRMNNSFLHLAGLNSLYRVSIFRKGFETLCHSFHQFGFDMSTTTATCNHVSAITASKSNIDANISHQIGLTREVLFHEMCLLNGHRIIAIERILRYIHCVSAADANNTISSNSYSGLKCNELLIDIGCSQHIRATNTTHTVSSDTTVVSKKIVLCLRRQLDDIMKYDDDESNYYIEGEHYDDYNSATINANSFSGDSSDNGANVAVDMNVVGGYSKQLSTVDKQQQQQLLLDSEELNITYATRTCDIHSNNKYTQYHRVYELSLQVRIWIFERLFNSVQQQSQSILSERVNIQLEQIRETISTGFELVIQLNDVKHNSYTSTVQQQQAQQSQVQLILHQIEILFKITDHITHIEYRNVLCYYKFKHAQLLANSYQQQQLLTTTSHIDNDLTQFIHYLKQATDIWYKMYTEYHYYGTNYVIADPHREISRVHSDLAYAYCITNEYVSGIEQYNKSIALQLLTIEGYQNIQITTLNVIQTSYEILVETYLNSAICMYEYYTHNTTSQSSDSILNSENVSVIMENVLLLLNTAESRLRDALLTVYEQHLADDTTTHSSHSGSNTMHITLDKIMEYLHLVRIAHRGLLRKLQQSVTTDENSSEGRSLNSNNRKKKRVRKLRKKKVYNL